MAYTSSLKESPESAKVVRSSIPKRRANSLPYDGENPERSKPPTMRANPPSHPLSRRRANSLPARVFQPIRRLSKLLPTPSLVFLKGRKNSDPGWTPKKLKRGNTYDVSSVEGLQSVDDLALDDVIIAVMGPTGTGKSTFIQRATKQDWGVGHSLQSQTSEVNAIRVQFTDGISLVLVDTPGFDDTRKSDLEILETIANWFKNVYSRKLEISGILYLHRISDNRMAGTPRKNLEFFQKLYGDEIYERVVLTTTMWAEEPVDGDPEELVYEERQTQLQQEYWADMISRGASTGRFRGTRESAWEILDSLITAATERQRNRIVLEIQQELVDLEKPVVATKAGRHLQGIMGELVQRQTELLNRIRDELSKTSDPEVLRALITELHDLRLQREKALKDMRQFDMSFFGRLYQPVDRLQKQWSKMKKAAR